MTGNAAQAVADARGARRGEGSASVARPDGGRGPVASRHDDGARAARAVEVRRAGRVVGAALRGCPRAGRRVGEGRRDVGEAEVGIRDVADGGGGRRAVARRRGAGAYGPRGAARR